ncbi:YitT family protein, partial [Bacillus inaquosorum]
MDVRNQTLRVLRDYVYILIGAAITAVSFNVFLLPNKIAAGGVSGI